MLKDYLAEVSAAMDPVVIAPSLEVDEVETFFQFVFSRDDLEVTDEQAAILERVCKELQVFSAILQVKNPCFIMSCVYSGGGQGLAVERYRTSAARAGR